MDHLKYFFSPETKGFYIQGLHGQMPADVFEISYEEYNNLIQGQAEGMEIVYKNRKVRLQERQVSATTWEIIRDKRDRLLTKCDWTQMPDAPMSEEVRGEWRTYRQLLRDITETFDDPNKVVWPAAPSSEE